MSKSRYRLEIDLEKPSITNTAYGVYNGIMSLVTGEGDYNVPSGVPLFAKEGLLKENNVKTPSQSVNIHGGGLISLANSGSIAISNTLDLSGFMSENQLFPSYKFVKVYEIIDAVERLDWSGIITTYTISPNEVTFSLGSRFQRILTKTPSKKASSLSFGVIADTQETKSILNIPLVSGVHTGIDAEKSFPATIYAASTYSNTNNWVGGKISLGQSADCIQLENLRFNTLVDDSLVGKMLYILNDGAGFISEIDGNKPSEFRDNLTQFKLKVPIEGFIRGFDAPKKLNFNTPLPSDFNSNISGVKYSVYNETGVKNQDSGAYEVFTPDFLSNDPKEPAAEAFPEWNMPWNPAIVGTAKGNFGTSINPYDPKMVYPVALSSSTALIMDIPVGLTLTLGDKSVSSIESIQNITEFSSYASTSGNTVTFQKNSLDTELSIEVYQPVGVPNGSFNSRGITKSSIMYTTNLLEVCSDLTNIDLTDITRKAAEYLVFRLPFDYYRSAQAWQPTGSQWGILGREEWHRYLQLTPNMFWEWTPESTLLLGMDEPINWGAQYANNSNFFENDNQTWMTGELWKDQPTPVWSRCVTGTRVSDHVEEPLNSKSQFSREVFSQTQRFDIDDIGKLVNNYSEINLSFGVGGTVVYDPRVNDLHNNKDFLVKLNNLEMFLSGNIVITAKTKNSVKEVLVFNSGSIYFGTTEVFSDTNIVKTSIPSGTIRYNGDKAEATSLNYFFGAGRSPEFNNHTWDSNTDHNITNLIKMDGVIDALKKLENVEYIECSFRLEFLIATSGREADIANKGSVSSDWPLTTCTHEMNLHKLEWQFVNKIEPVVKVNDTSLDAEYNVKWTGVSSIGGEDSFLTDVIKDTLIEYDKRPLVEIGAGWDDYRGVPLVDGFIDSITSTQSLYTSLTSLGDFAVWVDQDDKINIKKWINDLGDGVVSNFTLDHTFNETNIEQGSLNKSIQKASNEIYNQVYITFKLPDGVETIINIDGTLSGPFPEITEDWQPYAEGVNDYQKAKMWWERLSQANLRSPNNKIYEKTINYLRDGAGIDGYIEYVTNWHTFQKIDIPFTVPLVNGITYNIMQFASFTDEWITGETLAGDPITFYGWITSIKHDSKNNNIKLVFTSYIDPREMCILTTIDEGYGNQNPYIDSIDEGTGEDNAFPDSIDQQFDLSCQFN